MLLSVRRICISPGVFQHKNRVSCKHKKTVLEYRSCRTRVEGFDSILRCSNCPFQLALISRNNQLENSAGIFNKDSCLCLQRGSQFYLLATKGAVYSHSHFRACLPVWKHIAASQCLVWALPRSSPLGELEDATEASVGM